MIQQKKTTTRRRQDPYNYIQRIFVSAPSTLSNIYKNAQWFTIIMFPQIIYVLAIMFAFPLKILLLLYTIG